MRVESRVPTAGNYSATLGVNDLYVDVTLSADSDQDGDAVAIYSIGINRIDDGGDLQWGTLGLDVGFRLWNPTARGLPPLPPPPPPKEDNFP